MPTAQDILKKYKVDMSAEDVLAKYGIDQKQVSVPAFSTQGIEEELQRRKQDTGLEKGLKEFFGKDITTGASRYEQNVPGLAKFGARAIGEVGDIFGGLKDLGEAIGEGKVGLGDIPEIAKNVPGEVVKSLATTARHPVQSLQERPIQSLTDALIARGLTKAGAKGIAKVAGTKAAQAAKAGVGKTAAGAVSLTTGVEPELAERAISRTGQVFTKENRATDAYAKVGREIQSNIDDVGRQYSKSVAIESRELGKIPDRVVAYSDALKNQLADIKRTRIYSAKDPTTGKFITMGVDADDLSKIGNYERMLSQPQTARTLHKIKLDLDEQLSSFYKQSAKGGKPPSDVLEKSYSAMRQAINRELREISPGYAQANDRTSALIRAREALGNAKIGKENIGSQLKSIINTPEKRADWMPALQALDDALPEGRKFLDKLLDVHTAQKFNRAIRYGGLTEGVLLGGGAAYGLLKNPTLAAGLLAGTSPKLTQLGLRGLRIGSAAAKKLGGMAAEGDIIPSGFIPFKR